MKTLTLKILKYNFLVSLLYDYYIKNESKKIMKSHYVICSYPKSGNTFIRLILQDYFFDKTDLDSIDYDIPYIGKNSFKTKKLLKSHDLPNRFIKRGVYISRCPVKSSNSLYRSTKRRGLKISFLFFSILQYLELLDFYSKPVKHFAKWKLHAKKNDVLIVNYDDLINNTFNVVKKIIIHYGNNVDEKKLKKSINNCSIDKVTKLELKSKSIQSKLEKQGTITGAGFESKNKLNFLMNKYKKKYEEIKI